MKRVSTVLVFTLLVTLGYCQENMVTLSGGYTFATIEDTDVKTTGWRINGLYEYNSSGGKWAHGISFGYVSLSGESKELLQSNKYDINSWPIYYAPKYLIGSKSFKGFIKGAIGWQFSHLERSGTIGSLENNDSGFTGGGGAGLKYDLNEKIFLSAEYELLWLSNSFYNDGWLNTASLGLGIKF